MTATALPPRPLISVIVPVYDEEDNVVACYEAVTAVLATVADRYDWEFVFTDNHSSDRTFELLAELAVRDRRVRVFRFSRNFGFQRSIMTGYLMARGDAAVQLDCDLQDPPAMILDFLARWEEGFKVVYGIRRSRPEAAWLRGARRMFYRLVDTLSEQPLPHDAGDFRLVDRRVIDELRHHHDMHPYLRGMIAGMGFAQTGIPYDREARRGGRSKFNLFSLSLLALDGIVGQSHQPLRVASYIGVGAGALAVVTALVLVFEKLFLGASWPSGWAFLVVLVLASLAINAFLLGIIGEYIGRTYSQVRPQPLTIIENAIDAATVADGGTPPKRVTFGSGGEA